MTKRICGAALLVLILLPLPALAQFRDPNPKPRVSLSPTVAYRFPHTAHVEASLFTSTDRGDAEFVERRGGAALLGGELELRLFGPLSVIGSAAFAEPATNWVSENGGGAERYQGPRIAMYTAGLLVRLPEPDPDFRRFPIVSSIVVAPGLVREEPRRDPLPVDHPLYVPNPWGRIDHPALNLGVRATVGLGRSPIAVQVGVSDWITFWNTTEMERQLEQAWLDAFGVPVIADYQMGPSHLFQITAGVSLRF